MYVLNQIFVGIGVLIIIIGIALVYVNYFDDKWQRSISGTCLGFFVIVLGVTMVTSGAVTDTGPIRTVALATLPISFVGAAVNLSIQYSYWPFPSLRRWD